MIFMMCLAGAVTFIVVAMLFPEGESDERRRLQQVKIDDERDRLKTELYGKPTQRGIYYTQEQLDHQKALRAIHRKANKNKFGRRKVLPIRLPMK